MARPVFCISLVCVLAGALSAPCAAQTFSTANGSLVIFASNTSGTASCSAPGPQFASFGPYFANSAGVTNRCCVQSCSASLSGTFTFVGYMDSNNLPVPPAAPNALPALLSPTQTAYLYVDHLRASASAGNCGAIGSASADAQLGGFTLHAVSAQGDCGQGFDVPVQIALPVGNATSYTLPFSLSASHTAADRRLASASLAGNVSVVVDAAHPVLLADHPEPSVRSGDWPIGSSSYTTAHMNPAPDSRYVPVWSYMYATVPNATVASLDGSSTTTSAAWYLEPKTLMTWVDNWYGTGVQYWSAPASTLPAIGATTLWHNLAPAAIARVPLVSWKYRFAAPGFVGLSGSALLGWQGPGSGPINMIIAHVRASDGATTALLDTTVSEPAAESLRVYLPPIFPVCSNGDQILLGVRGTVADPGGRSIWLDDSAMIWAVYPGAVGVPLTERPKRNPTLYCYPNPSSGSVLIHGTLPQGHVKGDGVRLSVMDAGGRLVRTLISPDGEAATFSSAWDGRAESGRAAPPGVYFLRLAVGQQVSTRRLVLQR